MRLFKFGITAALFVTSYSAHADFNSDKQMILSALKSSIGTKDLKLSTVKTIRELPKKLGMLDMCVDYASTYCVEGEGGGQHGSTIEVKDGAIQLSHSSPTYRGNQSNVYCPGQFKSEIETALKNKNWEVVHNRIATSCLEIFVSSNLGEDKRLGRIDYAYRYDLKTGQLEQQVYNWGARKYEAGTSSAIINVFIIDKSKEKPEIFENGNMAGELLATPDFRLTEELHLTEMDVYQTVWNDVRQNLDSVIYKKSEGEREESIERFDSAFGNAGLKATSKIEIGEYSSLKAKFDEMNSAAIKRYNESDRSASYEEQQQWPEEIAAEKAFLAMSRQSERVALILMKNSEIKALASIIKAMTSQ